MRVAVIDLGKTNAKVALVDTEAATELTVETMPTPVVYAPPYPHIDTSAIETFIIEQLGTLASCSGVDAITVTTHGATGALIDKAGQLALPVLDYEHAGPDELAGEYAAIRPAFAQTGSPRLPGGLNLGAQLHWQSRRFPKSFARAMTFLTWPQFWVHWLCGARANDATSLGCHTDLYRPSDGRPSTLVQLAGWQALLPPVTRSGEQLGTLRAELAARCGLSLATPVHAGIHDSNASLVPHLIGREPPMTVVSTGTWVIVMAVGGRDIEADERRDCLINVDAYGRAVPSARFMGGREHALLTGRRGDASVERHSAADAALLSRLLDEGAYLLPSVIGETGPYPERTARWTIDEASLDRRVGSGARDTVIALYLAAMTATCIELAGGLGDTIVEGPFVANADYLQALTALLDGQLQVSESRTGTSVGAAMLVSPPQQSLATRTITVPDEGSLLIRDYVARWRERVAVHGR